MPFFCCPCTAYNLRIFVFPDYGKFRCTAFLAIHREIISLKAKTLYKPIFARLVTNSFFVIIATLIITFSIWIVKCCHQALYRYSFGRISTYTTGSLPLFFYENIHQHRLQHLPACQLLPTHQLLPTCESFNKPLLPATHTRHQPDTHTTRAGKDSHSIMIIIIIIISIRLIYIFILLTILCFLLDLFLYTKRKCLFVVVVVAVFVCKFVV